MVELYSWLEEPVVVVEPVLQVVSLGVAPVPAVSSPPAPAAPTGSLPAGAVDQSGCGSWGVSVSNKPPSSRGVRKRKRAAA